MDNEKTISIHNYSIGQQYFITVFPKENEQLEEVQEICPQRNGQ